MIRRRLVVLFTAVTLGILALLIACGGGSSSTTSQAMGSAIVSLSDPPSCTNFKSVFVTIDDVSASTSSSDTGWQQLASQLSSTSGSIKAVQVDLLHLPQNGQCLLAQLGSTQSLPVGDYGQMRLMLVANDATGVTLLPGSFDTANNQCASVHAWNCVAQADPNDPTKTILTALNLSSQAQTGEKIPPGQILGGPIHVAAGQSVDINLDFNACRSVTAQGSSQFRLDPTLVAYQVSQNLTGISGQVVQASIVSNALQISTTGVSGAKVALEMAKAPTDGSTNVDTIGNFLTDTDTAGNFNFCPLPPSTSFDIVTDAGAGGTTTGNFNATIVTAVPNGTKVTVPVIAETGGPATLSGNVTATAASNTATSITANLYALQTATSLEFAVPFLSGSTPPISQISLPCSGGMCTAPFSFVVPASNPLVGAFSSGNISWTLPAAPPVNYKVEATCSGSSATVGTFSTPSSAVTAGTTTTLPANQPPQLTGCN